jgi:hypothetical protein
MGPLLTTGFGALIMVILLIAAHPVSAAAENPPTWKIAEELDLIPTPQKISLGERRFTVDRFHIVRSPDERLANTGADEINQRIRNLGGEELPVTDGLKSGPAIVLATAASALGQQFADAVNVSERTPGEQGYVIEVIEHQNRPVVLALGSDKYGTLYAGITLRRLIQPGNSGVELLEAHVRDAPAFKRRSIGRINLDDNPNARDFIRWLGRQKINYINIRGRWHFTQEGDSRREIIERGRALTELAHDYGIRCKMGFMTHIHELVTDEEWEKYGGVKRRGGDRWFSWSALPVHRRKAKMVAEFVDEIGIDYVSLHVVDGGGYEDPESWSQRSDRAREMFGDNHAEATATMVNIYRDALKDVKPDAEFEMVPYPYHFQFAVPNFPAKASKYVGNMPGRWWTERMKKMTQNRELGHQVARDLRDLHRGLEERTADDVLITFREGGVEEFDAAGYLWKDHPIDIWSYLYRTRAWRGMWEPQDRFIKTWYRPNYRDMFFNALMRWHQHSVQRYIWAASGAEYTWNIDVPDANSSFTVAQRYYDEGVRNSTPYQKESLIPRVVHRLWGESGAAFEGLLTNNVSFYYLADPLDMAGHSHRERFLDPYQYYGEQVAAVRRAQQKINPLVDRLEQGHGSTGSDLRDDPVRYELAMTLYWTTNMAAIEGQIRWAWIRAERLAKYDRPVEAEYALETLLEQFPELKRQATKVRHRVSSDSRLVWSPETSEDNRSWSGGGFKDMDLDRYEQVTRERLEQLKAGDYEIPATLVD